MALRTKFVSSTYFEVYEPSDWSLINLFQHNKRELKNEFAKVYRWTDIKSISFTEANKSLERQDPLHIGESLGYKKVFNKLVLDIVVELKDGRKFSCDYIPKPGLDSSGQQAVIDHLNRIKQLWLGYWHESNNAPEPDRIPGVNVEVWLLLLGGLILFLYYVPKYNVGVKQPEIIGLILTPPVLLIPFVVYKIVWTKNQKTGWRFGLPVIALLAATICFMFYYGSLNDVYLKSNGITTTGRISEEVKMDKKNNVTKFYYCVFKVHDREYRISLNSIFLQENGCKVGDSLKVVYSPVSPKNNILKMYLH
ncbi:MAG TPA: hypothetical protein PLQ93_13680 [Bacteroidia bacterium]|nr:hypothetical protein [Bacteroidia bacterium]